MPKLKEVVMDGIREYNDAYSKIEFLNEEKYNLFVNASNYNEHAVYGAMTAVWRTENED